MERIEVTPRPGWEEIVTGQGLPFHHMYGLPYWVENACYRFTAAEIDALEKATYALNEMCLAAVEHCLKHELWDMFQIPPHLRPWIRRSWEEQERTIYGRFDLAYDGERIKLLEYNADTPTSLIEASVIQWHWFKDYTADDPDRWDQFNSLHERLIEAWRDFARDVRGPRGILYFSSVDDGGEDFLTATYLQDTAQQAGWQTEYIAVKDIGYNAGAGQFRDLRERPIERIFKLYPWEWMAREPFGKYLPRARTRWIEAPWKMLLSNKALLVVLHQLFRNSPYILPTAFAPQGDTYVKKPCLGREGANTQIIVNGETVTESGGDYEGPFVYQSYAPLTDYGGGYPVLGSWMVNGWAAGIGIREDDSRITCNECRFVPHLFERQSAVGSRQS